MLKCSAEAFARCPTRHLCERREDATFTEGSECDKFNQEVAGRPVTNGDTVRNMSDRQLAMLFAKIEKIYTDATISSFADYVSSVNRFMAWLKAPAEVPNDK